MAWVLAMSPMWSNVMEERSRYGAKKASGAISPLKFRAIMPKIKILYVEDELFLGKIVKESLESRGYEVLMETDGSKVLPVFTKQRPDVCVLDIMLPN